MKFTRILSGVGFTLLSAVLHAADLELSDSFQLPEAHSVRWLMDGMKNYPHFVAPGWEQLEDATKPPAVDTAPRSWIWKISEAQWNDAVKQRGEGRQMPTKVDLWIPEGVDLARGIVAISRHGSGLTLYRHEGLRQIARELKLALFLFEGDPVQRGFWPKSWLFDQLKKFGSKSNHPELEHAPLFLYGHSSAVGFSALFAADQTDRVWGWVAMRAGFTFQIYQPGAAASPGLVMFGEEDKYFANQHRAETLAIVPMMRKHHHALWNLVVEPKTGHGPGEATWRLVFSFLKHSFHARVPKDTAAATGPVRLVTLPEESGHLGQNWSVEKGGYQELSTAAFSSFAGEKATASWLLNGKFAADWKSFHLTGDLPQSAAGK